MKISKIFSALALIGIFALVSSCGKETCYTCVDVDGETETLCEDEVGSEELLDVAVGLAEAFGSDCTKQ